MADKKISQLPAATTPLAGTEILPIVQSNTTDQVSVANLTAGRSVSVADLTATTGNLIIGTSGKGIDFSATASGSGTMTSELLTDYEEGTWVLAITFGGGNTGLTYSLQLGFYTLIGRLVVVSGYIGLSNKGSSTGAALITGLPFTVKNSAGARGAGSLRLLNLTFIGQVEAVAINNATTIGLEYITEAGVANDITNTNFANNTAISFTYSYII